MNNKYPQIDEFDSTIEVYENATDIYITTVLAHDDDRDGQIIFENIELEKKN